MPKFLVKEVGKEAELLELQDDHKVFNKITGGTFSGYSVKSFVHMNELNNVMLLCNDTGKLDGLPFNCFLGLEPLVGNIVFVGVDNDGNSISLTKLQAAILSLVLECEVLSKC